ncbi:MAG TPA: hypothetical protein VD908_00450 [Cytophagales bacterium]|nr:hypothetical protein [Cytophagales bacterium]
MEYLPSLETILIVLAIIVGGVILFKVFKILINLVLLAAFVGIAYLTNPVLQNHQEAVQQKAMESSIEIPLEQIEVDDYLVVSLTKVGNDKKLVGIGAFTQVWIFGDLEGIE